MIVRYSGLPSEQVTPLALAPAGQQLLQLQLPQQQLQQEQEQELQQQLRGGALDLRLRTEQVSV